MHRRTFLARATAVGALGLAGCSQGSDDTVLGRPESQQADSEDLAYPAFGQRLPEATLPCPVHDGEVTTTEFVGERHVLLTFGYTRCHSVCPTLVATLAQVQADAAERGYADDVALLPVTFDPTHDTGDVLRSFAADRGADPDAGNWHFLRPESDARVASVVEETFGVAVQQTDAYEPTGDLEHDAIVHTTLVLLANRDGYVERAYHRQPPSPAAVIDDLEAVRAGYG